MTYPATDHAQAEFVGVIGARLLACLLACLLAGCRMRAACIHNCFLILVLDKLECMVFNEVLSIYC